MEVLDYRSSFAINTAAVDGQEVNTCRTQLLAKCELINTQTGETEEFLLGKSCIGENMYMEGGIAQLPTAEVSIIFHKSYYKLIKKYANHEDDIVQIQKHDEKAQRHDGKYVYWTENRFSLKTANAKKLKTPDDIISAILDSKPIVGRTTLHDSESKNKAILEYPVIYMNVHPPIHGFQVDVGPILYPDLESGELPLIARLELAYIMYQKFDEAEFAVRIPTEIPEGGDVKTQHYSKIIITDAENQLFVLDS